MGTGVARKGDCKVGFVLFFLLFKFDMGAIKEAQSKLTKT
jgi:hypothetical protein